MFERVVSKVVWVGRATVFTVGLAVVLALGLGVAVTALAAVPGDPFLLGRTNTVDALTSLVGNRTAPMLRLDNNGTGAALALQVEPGRFPLVVNATAGTAHNLSADRVDGFDGAQIVHQGIGTYEVNVTETVGAGGTNFVTAACDPGDLLQTGGYINLSPTASLGDNAGSGSASWTVELASATTTDQVTVRIRCFDFPPAR